MIKSWRSGAALVAVVAATATIVPMSLQPATNPAQAAADPMAVRPATPDRTSALEARRVGSVATPHLDWRPCHESARCATVKLPLDYDRPRSATIDVRLLKVAARKPGARLGSLFVNPGGPGGGVDLFALRAHKTFSPAILDRFDIIGMEPRGTDPTAVRCFRTSAAQDKVMDPLRSATFPLTVQQQAVWINASKALGRACSTTGLPLTASISTANIARDMEVLRRAVGDRTLTYYGRSYGSLLGQQYANLFPDRFRALAVDGVLDPVAWVGTARTAGTPVTERLRSAEGSARALAEIWRRCDAAGPTHCRLAGGAAAKYDRLAQRVKAEPIVVPDPSGGAGETITYETLIATTVAELYGYTPGEELDEFVAGALALTAGRRSVSAAVRSTVQGSIVRRLRTLRAGTAEEPYFNDEDFYSSVLCSETLNPAAAGSWSASAARADRRTKYFGAYWIWGSSQCASSTWTARDEDAYRGPFTRRTASPLLIVGNYYDPATNYDSAVRAAELAPNSRLVSSDSWGHTAYGSSTCLTGAVDRYLLRGELPAGHLVCAGDDQPFTRRLPAPATPTALR